MKDTNLRKEISIPEREVAGSMNETIEKDVKQTIDEVRNDVRRKKDENFEGHNQDLLRLSFVEKLKIAEKINEVIFKFAERNPIDLKELEIFFKNKANGLNLRKSIIDEERKLSEIMSAVKFMPPVKRNRMIARKLGLSKFFKNTAPYFCKRDNVLIAVLNEEDYEKIEKEKSDGLFMDCKIPLVILRAYKNFRELKLEALYSELIVEEKDRVRDWDSFNYHGNEYLKVLPKHELEKLSADDMEDYDDTLLDEMFSLMPFEAWFANEILGLNTDFDFGVSLIIEESKLLNGYDFIEMKEEANEVARHEFHHSICRFLPIKEKLNYEQERETILAKWLAKYAEEVLINSYVKRVVDEDFYLKIYDKETDFQNEKDRKYVNKKFKEELTFFRRVNKRIVLSKKPQLLSSLFSLVPAKGWKDLHGFLMNGGFPELGYFTKQKIPFIPYKEEHFTEWNCFGVL